MADQASSHRRQVPLKAAGPAETKSKGDRKPKSKAKNKRKDEPDAAAHRPPEPAPEHEQELEEAAAESEAAPTEEQPGPVEKGWRRFNIRWGVLLVVGPALVLTPIVLTWALLAVFGPMAGYAAAVVKTVRHDRLWSPLVGVLLGLATVAGLVVVVVATLEAMARRRARTQETEQAQSATGFALVAAGGVGLVATPLALFFGSKWLSERADSGTDIARLFTELDLSHTTMRSWVIFGFVVGVGVAVAAAKTGRMNTLQQRIAHAFDEWAEAKYDHEVNPDKW